MHPAFSIIFFTTASGLGYGLAAMLGLGVLDPASLSTGIAYLLALGLIGAGLLSSTLHLGNPQRAWRALTQWRSSWLSREGVMAILTFIPLVVSAWAALFERSYLPLPGVIGAVLCAITVYCTAMIYASLKSVQAWGTRLTPVCYLLFAAAGGATLATFFALCGAGAVRSMAFAAIVLIAAAWIAKLRWRDRLLAMEPLSTPESATGLGSIGKVALLERPHVTENYLTREMGFRIARKHAAKLARLAFGLGGIVPVLLLVAILVAGQGAISIVAAILAVLSFGCGILVERWLFFAEARHAVMNFYGQ
ncbi:MAG: DMSO reductase [Rhizobiales bacterium 65-79]|mgnify:CR=1 FL=1|jgi:DMSO reductase anchor subunit|nr:dimethyl sulfoxide reductase anchor subunit [Hyphomicrobiales bacterium]OJU05124.1 MAG: DMSO reductase [Rhizobiales bacterium 65-79]